MGTRNPHSPPSTLQVQAAIDRLNAKEESEGEEKPPLRIRLLRWIFFGNQAPERRRVRRQPVPGLVAYFWTGGTPRAFRIADVSPVGFYLLTDERWILETVILMTLQRTRTRDGDPLDAITVECKVVRWGSDGVGLEFVESGFVDLNTGEILTEKRVKRTDLEGFLERLNSKENPNLDAISQ